MVVSFSKNSVDRGTPSEGYTDLVGGGLVRSAGGWAAVRSMRKAGVFLKSDERILGSSDFVHDVLAGAQEALDQKYMLAGKGIGFSHIVSAVSELTSVSPKDLVGPSKERAIVKARVLVCYWSVAELGMSMTELGKKLGIAVSTIQPTIQSIKSCLTSSRIVFTV